MNAIHPPPAPAERLVKLSCAQCASTKFLIVRGRRDPILCLGHLRLSFGEGQPPAAPLAPEVLRLFDMCRCGLDRGEHAVLHPHGTDDGACGGFVHVALRRDTLPEIDGSTALASDLAGFIGPFLGHGDGEGGAP